jgi:hypothetical protein
MLHPKAVVAMNASTPPLSLGITKVPEPGLLYVSPA